MIFPFRLAVKPAIFTRLVEHLRATFERFPDQRTGNNSVYTIHDTAMGAFSVFFTQSPSFLDFQRTLQLAKGCNNTRTLFGMTQIPSKYSVSPSPEESTGKWVAEASIQGVNP